MMANPCHHTLKSHPTSVVLLFVLKVQNDTRSESEMSDESEEDKMQWKFHLLLLEF